MKAVHLPLAGSLTGVPTNTAWSSSVLKWLKKSRPETSIAGDGHPREVFAIRPSASTSESESTPESRLRCSARRSNVDFNRMAALIWPRLRPGAERQTGLDFTQDARSTEANGLCRLLRHAVAEVHRRGPEGVDRRFALHLDDQAGRADDCRDDHGAYQNEAISD